MGVNILGLKEQQTSVGGSDVPIPSSGQKTGGDCGDCLGQIRGSPDRVKLERVQLRPRSRFQRGKETFTVGS